MTSQAVEEMNNTDNDLNSGSDDAYEAPETPKPSVLDVFASVATRNPTTVPPFSYENISERRVSCHRCGNIRKKKISCVRASCPHIYCGRCADKMKEENGRDAFKDGCPVCLEICCCSNKSLSCCRKNHCYRKCPASKAKSNQSLLESQPITLNPTAMNDFRLRTVGPPSIVSDESDYTNILKKRRMSAPYNANYDYNPSLNDRFLYADQTSSAAAALCSLIKSNPIANSIQRNREEPNKTTSTPETFNTENEDTGVSLSDVKRKYGSMLNSLALPNGQFPNPKESYPIFPPGASYMLPNFPMFYQVGPGGQVYVNQQLQSEMIAGRSELYGKQDFRTPFNQRFPNFMLPTYPYPPNSYVPSEQSYFPHATGFNPYPLMPGTSFLGRSQFPDKPLDQSSSTSTKSAKN